MNTEYIRTWMEECIEWKPEEDDPCRFAGYVYSDAIEWANSEITNVAKRAFWAGVKWGREEANVKND